MDAYGDENPEAEDGALQGQIRTQRMQKLQKEITERFGPAIQMFLVDLADFYEKVKNTYVFRRPAATRTSLTILTCCSLFLCCIPGWLQYKASTGYLGFQFFVIWPLQDRHPRLRRALNPIWWMFWDVKSDADLALEVMKHRHREETPAVNSKDTLHVSTSRRNEAANFKQPKSGAVSVLETTKALINRALSSPK